MDLDALAEAHELSGGADANVVRHAALNALRVGREHIVATDLRQGVSRELRKEGRTVQDLSCETDLNRRLTDPPVATCTRYRCRR